MVPKESKIGGIVGYSSRVSRGLTTFLIIIPYLSILLTSCSSGAGRGDSDSDKPLVAALINAATGGTVTVPSPHPLAGASITIPANALVIDTTIRIYEAPLPNSAAVVGLAIDVKPDGTVFSIPATVTMLYSEADLPHGIAEDMLIISLAKAEISGALIPLSNVTVDRRAHIVSGETFSLSVFVVAAKENRPPIAKAGSDHTLRVGQTMILDGSDSSDPETDRLRFQWSFVSQPQSSNATLANATTISPSFVPNVAGSYVVQLIVNDGTINSQPDTVSIIAIDSSPAVPLVSIIVDRDNAQALTVAERLNSQARFEYLDRILVIVEETELNMLSDAEKNMLQTNEEISSVFLRHGVIDTRQPLTPVAPGLTRASIQEDQLALIHFIGPVKDEWREQVKAVGNLMFVSYIPNNSYLIWTDRATLANLQAIVASTVYIDWVSIYEPAYSLHPELTTLAFGAPQDVGVTIQFVDHDSVGSSIAFVEGKASEVLQKAWKVGSYRNVRVVISSSELVSIAHLHDVVNIEPWIKPSLFGERQGQIVAGPLHMAGSTPIGPGYFAWLTDLGFNTNFHFAVDVTDSGFDRGQLDALTIHKDFLDINGNSRIVYVRRVTETTISTTAADNLDTGGHGTLTASIIGGFNITPDTFPNIDFEDTAGYQYGLGIAPFVHLGISTVLLPEGWTNPNFSKLISSAYQNSARISNNSWGVCGEFCCPPGFLGAYNVGSQEYDSLVRDARPGDNLDDLGNQGMTIVFAAGNQGRCPNEQLGNYGATAKNTIVVGASESFNPAGNDGCSEVTKTDADDARDIAHFSSRGPTQDKRIKPDIMAPGTRVIGAASQATGYDGLNVCGAYFPEGQTLYTQASGTSQAAPAVAGAAALVRQWFLNQDRRAPSPAMTKAYLMNTATYMTGAGANENLPSNEQGMGRLNLGRAFDNVPRNLVDQTHIFHNTGETFTIAGTIGDPNTPFRVTLVWTDAPGSTVGNSWNNNLDLEVRVGQTGAAVLYRGNNLEGEQSTPGGGADERNNAESVWLPAGTTGSFTITVRASNIVADGVPGNTDATDQDFALVVYNSEGEQPPSLRPCNTTRSAFQGRCSTGVEDNLPSGCSYTYEFVRITSTETISLELEEHICNNGIWTLISSGSAGRPCSDCQLGLWDIWRDSCGGESNKVFQCPREFTVDSTVDAVDINPGDGQCVTDTGVCTLRAAIQETNALLGADIIHLPPGVFTLSLDGFGLGGDTSATGDLDITDNVTISGADAANTIIESKVFNRIFHIINGSVHISSVTMRGGTANQGAGIFNNGHLTLMKSVVTSNNTTTDFFAIADGIGGGIFNAGTLTLIGSTINNNRAFDEGGGIFNSGQLSILNSTLSGNVVDGFFGDFGGGAIFNNGFIYIKNSTINGNRAQGRTESGLGIGGGILNSGLGRVVLKNTIVARNVGIDCANSREGKIISNGYNLDSDNTCFLEEPTDIPGTDPLLGPLTDNGGPTQTHALQSKSPAIDAIDVAHCIDSDRNPISTDQRGVTRPQGVACDIGAYEAP